MVLADLSKEQLNELVISLGEKSFRAGQIYNNINNGKSISQMTDLSNDLRARLLEKYSDSMPSVMRSYAREKIR